MNPLRKMRIQKMLTQLQNDFPNHFPTDERLPLPWAKSLWKELRAHYQNTPLRFEASGIVIRKAIMTWHNQHQYQYLQSMANNQVRYDLIGRPVEKIPQKQLINIKRLLEALKKKSTTTLD